MKSVAKKNINMKYKKTAVLLFLLLHVFAIAQNNPDNVFPDNLKWSERTALSILDKYPEAWKLDGNDSPKWDYKMGFVLSGFERLYQEKKDKKYLDYIKNYVDRNYTEY